VRRTASLAAVLAIALAGASLAYLTRASAAGLPAAQPDGKAIFAARCSSCHATTGLGNGPYPPLAGNPDLSAADTAGLIGTLLNGRSGPITINGKSYSGAMPAWKGTLSDAEIAAVLSYVRSAWGNKGAAVSSDQVAAAANPLAASGPAIFAAKCGHVGIARKRRVDGRSFPACLMAGRVLELRHRRGCNVRSRRMGK
jgi:mono/diheme cytochrome c family protein